MVASLAEHSLTRLAHARQWINDLDPLVAEFAAQLVRELEEEYARHAAEEEYERQRFGT